MTTSAHPSPEVLGAYFDKELPPQDLAIVDAHLPGCDHCRSELEWFGLLAAFGPRVEESLPGEAYWKDLPDRVLQRVLMENAPAADPVAPAGEDRKGFWSRLLGAQPAWRMALVGAAALAVVAGVWTTVERTTNPWTPVGSEFARSVGLPEGTLVADLGVPENLQPAAPPEAESATGYAQRIFFTYGDTRENMGTSLDLSPGAAVPGGSGSGMGTQVSQTALFDRNMQALADEVVGYSCGEDSLVSAFLAALRAEQVGDYRAAAWGYQKLMHLVGPEHRIFPYAEYRLSYLVWKVRMDDQLSRQAQAMAELHRMADRYYQSWEKSGEDADCRKAWCMNRVLQNLGPEVNAPVQVQVTSNRIEALENCMK